MRKDYPQIYKSKAKQSKVLFKVDA